MLKYDLFGFQNLIKEGYSEKVSKVEKALGKIRESLKPIAVHDHHVFAIDESNGDTLRMRYTVNESKVKFSSPTKFTVTNDLKKFKVQESKILGQIIEALGDEDDSTVVRLKNEWLGLTRSSLRAQAVLESDITSQPLELAEAKKNIGELLESNSRIASLIATLPENKLASQFVSEGVVEVDINEPVEFEAPITEEIAVGRKILEARESAKRLNESPAFAESVCNIVLSEDDADDYLAIVEGNHQEFLCLTSREMVNLIEGIYESHEIDADRDRVKEIVSSIVRIAELKLPQQMSRLYEFVGEHGVDYAKNMKLLESKMNVSVYTTEDLDEIIDMLGSIINESNFVLSPEIVSEMKKAYEAANAMKQTGIIEDSTMMNIINLLSQYTPGQLSFGEGKEVENGDKSIEDAPDEDKEELEEDEQLSDDDTEEDEKD